MVYQQNSSVKDQALADIFQYAYGALSTSEKKLVRKIIENKHYPFVRLSRDIYKLEHRNRNFFAIFLFVGAVAIWMAVGYIARVIQMKAYTGILGGLGLTGSKLAISISWLLQ